jgi:phthalate 4,5-dioxygenase
MMTAEENDLLCRVEGDAPMGQLMRRHWIPACMSEEVAERDGTPVRVRLLGEDLVVFRDSKGRLGVLDEYCPHRRASLALGRNEKCGLRCLYHGWKFDVDGNVLEMSSEPADSGFPRKVTHTAYPAQEAAGFVWTYMGPAAEAPAFELPAFAPAPDVRVSILKIKVRANWAQITEGQIDSAHSSSLHSSDMVPARVDSAKATDANWLRPSTDRAPRLEVQRTSFGFRYAAIRKPIADAATHQYVRTTVFVAPFTSLIPPNDIHNVATVLVPMDDTSTYFYFIAWNGPDKPGIDQETWRKFSHAQPGIDLDADFANRRTRENNYLQDRNAMKLGNFTGIPGIPNQDIAMWETMGRTGISDRTRERLGASDIAVIQFRRIMVEAARQVASGGPALGRTAPHLPHAKISSFEGVVPKTTDWRTLGVAPEELALHRDDQVAQDHGTRPLRRVSID